MIDKVCLQCGASFRVKNYRKDIAKYCSHSCAQKSQRKEYRKPCSQCGEIFYTKTLERLTKGKFCSNKCKYRNQYEKSRTIMNCEFCGKLFNFKKRERVVSKSNGKTYRKKYCSPYCRTMGSRDSFQLHIQTIKRALRKNGLMRRCQICGYSKHPEILGIHHKDGDRNNNYFKNLIVVCPNCHSLAHGHHQVHNITDNKRSVEYLVKRYRNNPTKTYEEED